MLHTTKHENVIMKIQNQLSVLKKRFPIHLGNRMQHDCFTEKKQT